MFQARDFLRCIISFRPQVAAVTEITGSVRRVTRIAEGMRYEPNVFYIGRYRDVQHQLRFQKGCIFLLIREDQDDIGNINGGDNLVLCFPENTDVESLAERCQSYIQTEEESADAKGQLMEMYLRDASLDELVEKTAGMIGNPVAILDNGYRVTCHSKGIPCDDPQWNQIIGRGYCSYEVISQFDSLSEADLVQKEQPENLMVDGCLSSPVRRLVSRIFVEGQRTGFLLSIESASEFRETSVRILDFMARLAGKVSAYEALKSGEEVASEMRDYLADAIEGFEGSGERLKKYLKKNGFHDRTPHVLIRFNLQDLSLTDSGVEQVKNELKMEVSPVIFSIHSKYALALAECEGPENKLAKSLSENEVLNTMNFRIYVSDAFTGTENLARYDRQTRHAEELGLAAFPERMALAYDEIRRMDEIFDRMEPEKIPLSVREKELRLYEYDRQHSTEYFKTLFIYLKNSRSLHETADEMHIHKNTVSYRIARIREIVDADLNDADVRIGFYTAYLTSYLMDLVEEGKLQLRDLRKGE